MSVPTSPLELWPVAASANAVETDHIIICFTLLTLVLVGPIFIGITYFAFRYRRGREVDRSNTEDRSVAIELSWMIIPFVLSLIFFFWAAVLFDNNVNPPGGAMQIEAVAKQWMWKFQHPGGQAEINDLHVPVGQPILIRMISQDVIHGLYIPAMRVQFEVLPGRFTKLWFKPNRVGTYHLFCSEYCGTDHSVMGGFLYVMQPQDYSNWLADQHNRIAYAEAGKSLFASYGCTGCHVGHSTAQAPTLADLYDSPVRIRTGGTVVANDAFIRNKILHPNRQPVAGYSKTMPGFDGRMPDADLTRLIAYVKTLDTEPAP